MSRKRQLLHGTRTSGGQTCTAALDVAVPETRCRTSFGSGIWPGRIRLQIVHRPGFRNPPVRRYADNVIDYADPDVIVYADPNDVAAGCDGRCCRPCWSSCSCGAERSVGHSRRSGWWRPARRTGRLGWSSTPGTRPVSAATAVRLRHRCRAQPLPAHAARSRQPAAPRRRASRDTERRPHRRHGDLGADRGGNRRHPPRDHRGVRPRCGGALLTGVDLIARKRRRAPPSRHPTSSPKPHATSRGLPRRLPRPARASGVELPARGEPVIDRKPLLAAIGRRLREGRPVVLAPDEGRAGVGVTTAMIEFAHRNRDDYDIVWWIAAQDPQLVGERLAPLAEAIGLAVPTDTAGQATAALLDALGQAGPLAVGLRRRREPRPTGSVPARRLRPRSGRLRHDRRGGEQAAPLVVPPFTRDPVRPSCCGPDTPVCVATRRTAWPRHSRTCPLSVVRPRRTLAKKGTGVPRLPPPWSPSTPGSAV